MKKYFFLGLKLLTALSLFNRIEAQSNPWLNINPPMAKEIQHERIMI